MDEKDEDLLLLERIERGDESSLAQLMSKYKDAIFRFAFRYLGDESDSEEVTEDTFFRVYQNASRFSPKASVKTWMFSIALNLARDRLRKRKKFRKELSFDQFDTGGNSEVSFIENLDSGEPSAASMLQIKDNVKLINNSIGKLPEKLRFPFVFCVLEGHTYDECAAILKSNRKTIETRIYRARLALRGMLKDLIEKV